MKFQELTALYSPLDIEYSQFMSGPYQDLSYRGDDCEIIAGLKDNRITGFYRPMVAVGDEKSLKLHIERLYDICRNIYYIDFLIDGKLSVISQFLLRQGYKARPYYTQIIDLNKSIEELHADLRKSYKSLVNQQRYDLIPGSIDDYRELHQAIKGNTRNDESWRIQDKMIMTGQAFCMLDNLPDTKAGTIFYINEYCAYYASAASKPDANSHAVIWESIRTCKAMGCRFVEMGEQIFYGDEKLVNISKFKRGFGKGTYTRLMLEKE